MDIFSKNILTYIFERCKRVFGMNLLCKCVCVKILQSVCDFGTCVYKYLVKADHDVCGNRTMISGNLTWKVFWVMCKLGYSSHGKPRTKLF